MLVSDLTQVGGVSTDTPTSWTNKTDHLEKIEMVLKWPIKHNLKTEIKSLNQVYYV
jgi:hypothetical protein